MICPNCKTDSMIYKGTQEMPSGKGNYYFYACKKCGYIKTTRTPQKKGKITREQKGL